jgi:Flp pilus assembly protein TadD
MDRIESLKEIVAADPTDALARFMLGQALVQAHRGGEAVEHLREAVRLDPDHTASCRWLGQALEQAGDLEEAAAAYRAGLAASERTRDLQTGKEIRVFLNRLEARLGSSGEGGPGGSTPQS